jgi:hypothetical protein
MDIGLLLLRLAVGLTLAAHGTKKLFRWFGGPGIEGISHFFAMLGFPPGRRHALMAWPGGDRWWPPSGARVAHAACVRTYLQRDACRCRDCAHQEGLFRPERGVRVPFRARYRRGSCSVHWPRFAVIRRATGIFPERYILGHGCVDRRCPWRGHGTHPTTRSPDAASCKRRVVTARLFG